MTMSDQPADRHVPPTVLETYAAEGVSGVFPAEGTPAGRIQISPGQHVITLLVQAIDNVPGPDVQSLANLEYELEDQAGIVWHRLDVAYEDNLGEVYPVLCTVLDRVQLKGESFTDAVLSVLVGLGEILEGRGGLSREQQVGLFGELLVLLSLAAYLGTEGAVKAWRGPDREEHDFGMPDSDLEVKTTTFEERSHWINSLAQLHPSPGRALRLLSIQVTTAGAEAGMSLAEIVQTARARPGMPTAELNRTLESAGYYDRHADLYKSRWRLRSVPIFYLIDGQFPALTTERLFANVPQAERITDVRYRIRLEGLTGQDELFPIALPGLSA
ncbi:PD-(D/E)XK motif protein [Mycobacterium colombiense]|nr:PD-(D/E)XK motif protein [Mycobacterium colombiense]